MSRDKQMFNDLVEIFDEEYSRRNLITPQNTAEKLTAKGYSKASEIFEEIEKVRQLHTIGNIDGVTLNVRLYELKKKYIGKDINVTTNTEGERDNGI